jgi:hypothetical protein
MLTFTGRGKYLSAYTNRISRDTLLNDFIKDRDSFYNGDCKNFENLRAEIIENSKSVQEPVTYFFLILKIKFLKVPGKE